MIRARHTNSLCRWRRFAAVALIAFAFNHRPLPAADDTVHGVFASARSTNDELSQIFASRLGAARSKLQTFEDLKSQGHATWLEVAESQAAVFALEAEHQAASDFGVFIGL